MTIITPLISAYPAPLMPTLVASHMHATFILLYRHIAWRASLGFCSNTYSPFLKNFSLLLTTSQVLMPRNLALKAKMLKAVVALNHCCISRLSSYDNIFALWVWTVLFQMTLHYLFLLLELFKLIECLLVTYLLYEFIRNITKAAFFRAL